MHMIVNAITRARQKRGKKMSELLSIELESNAMDVAYNAANRGYSRPRALQYCYQTLESWAFIAGVAKKDLFVACCRALDMVGVCNIVIHARSVEDM